MDCNIIFFVYYDNHTHTHTHTVNWLITKQLWKLLLVLWQFIPCMLVLEAWNSLQIEMSSVAFVWPFDLMNKKSGWEPVCFYGYSKINLGLAWGWSSCWYQTCHQIALVSGIMKLHTLPVPQSSLWNSFTWLWVQKCKKFIHLNRNKFTQWCTLVGLNTDCTTWRSECIAVHMLVQKLETH